MDKVLLLKFSDSVDWDRILLRPTESSLTLQTHKHTHRGETRLWLSLFVFSAVSANKATASTHPAMLLVETLLANERPDRTRLEPSRDWRRLSEG